MRIAISATGTDLAAQVDPRFGRCQYFIIADPETIQFEALENPNIMAGGGAGISTAQMIANKGVQIVLTGNCGPNAYQTLSAAGVQVITGVAGTVGDAIEGYKAGRLQATSRPSVGAHFGMGRGMGMGPGMMSMASPPQPMRPGHEVAALKTQAQMLGQQLSQIQRRIEELEKRSK